MKKIRKSALLLCMMMGWAIGSFAQGITFEQTDWKTALARAKKEKKMIFVDFYTSWCGPCKEMSKNIMTQAAAGKLFNREFVNFKQDAEKGEGPELAKKYDVTAYPTFIFVDHRGELIYKFLGRRELDDFLKEGEKALNTYRSLPLLAKMQRKYKHGERDTAFLHQYYELLKGRGEGAEVLNDYLKGLPESELLQSAYIAEISLYDSVLYNRLMQGWKQLDPVKDRKASTTLKSNLMKSLGGCLQSCMERNREDELEALLALKAALGETESAVSQMMGGGIAYSPTPHLRLDFYQKNGKDEKFRSLLETYMQQTVDTITLQETMMQKGFRQMLDSLRNDPKELENVKRMKILLTTINDLRYKVLTMSVVNYTNHYWNIAPAKDENTKQRCEQWVSFVGHLEPSLVGNSVEFLMKLGEKEKAVQLVKEAVQLLQDDPKAQPEDLQRVKEQLQELQGE